MGCELTNDGSNTTERLDFARHLAGADYLLIGSEGGWTAVALPRAGTLVLGRGGDCDVRVDHPSVSRRHAELALADGRVTLRDLGSANGTRVGSVTLPAGEPRPVALAQPFSLGAVTCAVHRSIGGLPVAPPAGSSYARTRLREECARAARTGGQLAFALIAVRGAAVGQVERELATELRVSDVSAPAEPGTYELVLPDAPPDAARAAVARIAARLRAAGCAVRSAVAHVPTDATDADRTVAIARSRLTDADRTPSNAPPPPWLDLVDRIADSPLSVLIRGETGVGKELCAAEIHRRSSRRDRPFVKLNCAAFTETLLESELFGYERGAFTGAVAAKPGLLETADGGTVFLDEVGDLPMPLQAKLLRVLEDREVLRVGALKPRRVDVRFVSATNRPLERDIAEGKFRRDLLYRLAGVVVEIPPLRERVDEIEGLAASFVQSICRDIQRPDPPALTPAAIAALRAQPWPGNIRELRNVVERAVLLARGDAITPEDLGLAGDDGPTLDLPSPTRSPSGGGDVDGAAPQRAPRALTAELAEVERRQILAALEQFGGNQTRAARHLGISRTTLQKRMDDYGIPRPRKRRGATGARRDPRER